LSADRLDVSLQKRALMETNATQPARKQDPQYKQLKQAQLDALKHVAQQDIELMYLDESGCQLWSPAVIVIVARENKTF